MNTTPIKSCSSVNLGKENTPYNPSFVEKVFESRQQAKNGKITRIKEENLKAFLDLQCGVK